MNNASETNQEMDQQQDWVNFSLYSHLIVYLIGFGYFINAFAMEKGRESMLFYFGFSTVWLIVGGLNNSFCTGGVRTLVSMAVTMVNTFLIPFSIYSYGTSVGPAALGSIIYIVLTIAISPYSVSISASIAGIYFSFLLKDYYVPEGDSSAVINFMHIIIAYISLIFLALGWRMFIVKLYHFFTNAGDSSENQKTNEVSIAKKKFDDLVSEQRRLKQEIAAHIVEINDITGFQRDVAE